MQSRYCITLNLLLLVANTAVSQQPSPPIPPLRAVSIPKIDIVYPRGGTVFDKNCANFLSKAPRDGAIDEIANRRNEFQVLWDRDGSAYLNTTFEAIGLKFPYAEVQVTLTACAITSMSAPLIINVNRFLTSDDTPYLPSAFPEIVFHELMHTYVRPVNDHSELRKKYAGENPVVLNHLHVMALEKMLLLKLNKTDLLAWMDKDYRSGNLLPAYKRAWEIVNEIEGFEPFIAELKAVANTR